MRQFLSTLIVLGLLVAMHSAADAQKKSKESAQTSQTKKKARKDRKKARNNVSARKKTTASEHKTAEVEEKPGGNAAEVGAASEPVSAGGPGQVPRKKTITASPSSGTQASKDKVIGTDKKGRTIYEGPRGGHYYINANGNKVYVKRNE